MTSTKDDGRPSRLIAAFIAALSADGLKRHERDEYRQGHPKLTEAEIDLLVAADEKSGKPVGSLAKAKAILAGIPEPKPPIQFVNWDHRPAVLVGDKAFAVLRPGARWVSVDRDDVGHTAAVMTEEHWRLYFMREKFGNLDTWQFRPGQDNVPQSRPLPRAKDFDDAALAIQATWLEQKAREAIKPDYTSIFTSELAWAQKYWTAKWEDTELALHASLREKQAGHRPPVLINGHRFPGVMALVLSRTLQQVADDAGDGQMMLYATDMERRARAVIELYLSFRDWNETAH